MKYLKHLIVLLTLYSCNEHANSKIVAQNTIVENFREQHVLGTDILKYIEYDEKVIALTHAAIIDGTGSTIKENQTVLVVNGQFYDIGEEDEITIPKDAVKIDCKDKTIIPGIIGMHNHLHIPQVPFTGEVAAKLYLASGVTTIQTCGSVSTEKEIQLSKKLKKGS
ncbi:amidohydrolase family protein [Maribacter halichondriae]|uniref:amidohydrolase family protein n=1 Tax=Maribacter halichondriae TaxID=2980554 RepID=UPI002359AF64|nr:hypothetical protein [Maribacter sp. Hal144]